VGRPLKKGVSEKKKGKGEGSERHRREKSPPPPPPTKGKKTSDGGKKKGNRNIKGFHQDVAKGGSRKGGDGGAGVEVTVF